MNSPQPDDGSGLLEMTDKEKGKVTDLWQRLTGAGKSSRKAAVADSSRLDRLHQETLAASGAKPEAATTAGEYHDLGLDPKGEIFSQANLDTSSHVGRSGPLTNNFSDQVVQNINIEQLINLLRQGKIAEFNQTRPSANFSLEGVNLANLDLQGVDFRGINFSRAILTGCNLNQAQLQNSILDRADLRRTTLNQAKFFGASLRYVDFRGVAEAKHAEFNQCDMRGADLGSSANFSAADFTGARLITATLTDSNFSSCQMVGTYLAGAILTNTVFKKANLHKAMLFQANGQDVDFSESNLTEAVAVQSHFTSSNRKLAEGKVSKTNFDKAWTMGFRHNGAIAENLLLDAVSDTLPPEGQFKASTTYDEGKRLINNIPGTDKVLFDSAMEELDDLIGLDEVKQQVRQLTAFVEANQARLRMGLPPFKCILHRVYLGEPGTGKTTVARIEAKLYYALGLLKKGHVVETDKSGFIAGYAGQSLGKAHETIDSALGGTLIADEIYALTETKNDDYAKDAMAVIVKRLWDDRDKFCCIFLGYGDEMEAFLNTNKGMKRRIGAVIRFPSYSSGELIDIYKQKMERQKFNYNAELLAEASMLFAAIKEKDGKNFGNAGTVENTVEHLSMRLSCRLKTENKLTDEHSQRNPQIDDLPFKRMSGYDRSLFPKLETLRWVGTDGKELSVKELKIDGKFPNLTAESINAIKLAVMKAQNTKQDKQ